MSECVGADGANGMRAGTRREWEEEGTCKVCICVCSHTHTDTHKIDRQIDG